MPDLRFEDAAGATRGAVVCGIDEAGRGPLAGPVVAAAVILPSPLPPELTAAINDSKALSKRQREALEPVLRRTAGFGIGRAEAAEIDAINILQATFLAMARALADLSRQAGRVPDIALVDGNRPPPLVCPVRTIVRGDSLSLSIAAASIIAKVERDRIMAALARTWPGYGWEQNAGYPTAAHRAALVRLGASPEHRRTFAPVSELVAATT